MSLFRADLYYMNPKTKRRIRILFGSILAILSIIVVYLMLSARSRAGESGSTIINVNNANIFNSSTNTPEVAQVVATLLAQTEIAKANAAANAIANANVTVNINFPTASAQAAPNIVGTWACSFGSAMELNASGSGTFTTLTGAKYGNYTYDAANKLFHFKLLNGYEETNHVLSLTAQQFIYIPVDAGLRFDCQRVG